MKRVVTSLLAVSVLGCGSGGSTPSDPPTGTNQPEQDLGELEPDPITRPLSEAEVRSEATRLAERAFVERAPTGVDGRPVPPATFPPTDWIVEQRPNGWALRNEPPAGAWARVEMGAFGNDARVEVGFATQ
jgi:hypothetical protein